MLSFSAVLYGSEFHAWWIMRTPTEVLYRWLLAIASTQGLVDDFHGIHQDDATRSSYDGNTD